MKEIIRIPDTADRSLLQRFRRASVRDLESQFRAEHREFLRIQRLKQQAIAPMASALRINRSQARERLDEFRQRMRQEAKRHKRRRFTPVKGHNPVRYAPLDFPWDALNCGGIGGCQLYGTDATSGRVGAVLQDYIGGGAGAASAVGFWYFAQQSGTLFVNVQASVWGRAEVYAFPGYAAATANLRVYVQQWRPATSVSASTDVYNRWAVFSADYSSWDWELKSVSITTQVQAGNWYAIWGGLWQTAYAGGIASAASNFDAYIGPIVYLMV